MKRVKVAILCITYNHQKYIKNAIEAFLNQKTEYDYHIYVHDDASNDGTSDIVREMAEKYPEKITAIIQKENLYKKNRDTTMGACEYIKKYVHGDYFALCEGDDFWIDPNKLQLQVDYMEKHPECIMTAHNAIVFDQKNGEIRTMSPYDKEQDISLEETVMWYHGNIPTASAVLRPEAYLREGIFLNCCASGDWVIQLLSQSKGKIHYFDRIMSCYRSNVPGSYTATKWVDLKKRIPIRVCQMIFLITYDFYLNREHHDIVMRKLYDINNSLLQDISGFSNDEVISIFKEIDYFHEGMSEEQHQKYKKYILKIRDAVLMRKDDNYCPQNIKRRIGGGREVFIYGAGYYGEKALKKLLYSNIAVNGVIVSDGQEHPEMLHGIKIYKLSEIAERIEESCVILGVANELAETLKQNLKKFNNVNIIQLYGLEFEE